MRNTDTRQQELFNFINELVILGGKLGMDWRGITAQRQELAEKVIQEKPQEKREHLRDLWDNQTEIMKIK